MAFLTTGEAGQTLYVKIPGVHNVTSISFGGADADYREIGGALRITVPLNAAWGKVALGSEVRQITGYSKYLFVPKPIITAFSPNGGLPEDNIIIIGYGFSGITGAFINNLPMGFTVLDNNTISGIIPEGNVTGPIKLLAQSGLCTQSYEHFASSCYTTGTYPNAGKAGDTIQILGQNFIESALFDVNYPQGQYLVKFNGHTGIASRVNNNRLDCIVTEDAVSGPIYVCQSMSNNYPSNADFTVIPPVPTIDSIYPTSGQVGDNVVAYGTYLLGVQTVRLSSNDYGTDVNNLMSSAMGNAVYFTIPSGLDEIVYDIVVVASGGLGVGSGLFSVV